jgi:hypothetical protein
VAEIAAFERALFDQIANASRRPSFGPQGLRWR